MARLTETLEAHHGQCDEALAGAEHAAQADRAEGLQARIRQRLEGVPA